MWSVWFYTPSGGRKFIDRFNTRNAAEAYRRRLGRLIGALEDLDFRLNIIDRKL
jgi:hypothetical protein